MNELCGKCRFTPKSKHPPVPQDELRSFRAPPIGNELEDYLRVISEEERDLASYVSEIARLRTTVRRLKKERDALATRLQERRSILSISRRIPRELLAEIFSYCVAPDPAATPTITGANALNSEEQEEEWWRAYKAPFILSQVSSRWREIVLDTAELWSTIYIRLSHRHPLHGLRLYLERSKDASLDVTIRGSGRKSDGALRTLMSPNTMPRFRRLAIIETHIAPQIFDAFHNTWAFPRLESLYLLHIWPSQLHWSWLWEPVRRAPRLNTVFAGGWGMQVPFEAFTGSNIRSLELTSSSDSGEGFEQPLLNALPMLHNLEALTLRNLEGELSRPTFPPVRCERLRDLKIVHNESSTHRGLLRHLELPNLVSLTLNFRKQISSFEGLLIPLSNLSSLRLLSLTFNWPPTDRIARILDKVPNLTVFEAKVHNHRSCFDSLAPFPTLCAELAERPRISPKLRSLTLAMEEDRVTNWMLSNFQDFLEARDTDGRANKESTKLTQARLITTSPLEYRERQGLDEEATAALRSIRTACPNFEYTFTPRVLFRRENPIGSYHSFLD
ncbi:hypothetical protein V5O48_015057 [Marasmius crinis-equi]|uniref:F-box domain-containing protein n=1 Tax=Marasmius crinis-equi TaxID=585013 RepID=A0ABR3EVM5_9AGAR